MRSKRYRAALKQFDASASHPIEQAVARLQDFPKAKFDETVELAVSLNLDPKKSDELVRGTVTLPHGTGRKRRVLVFCQGEDERLAKEAGADVVGGKELIERIQGGWMDFDVVISTPPMMREVSKLGKILGPRGLMPNPKAGTVTTDVTQTVCDVTRGKIEFRMDKLANLHVVVGKRSFQTRQLIENARAVLGAIVRAAPMSLQGRAVRRASLSSTMSPSIGLTMEGLETTADHEG